MTEINNRYSLGRVFQSNFSHYINNEIEEYIGYDNLLKQDVMIKTFKLPNNKRLGNKRK